MRISLTPQVCSGLLCSFLILIAGCGNPSSQSLDSLTVTATPSTLPVGGAAILKAVAHLSDGTTQDVTAGTQWTSSNTALATIGNGSLTAKASGTVTVQAAYVEVAPAGTSPSAATASPQNLSASTQITITAAGTSNVPTITWNAPAAISYGTALSSTQLNATANVAGTFAYTPAAGTVLKVGKQQQLSATFTPTDTKTYSAATASVQLTVNQATPVITWAAPAAIPTGTALSATQLDATANVPGSFMYNPAAGAVLAAGSQQLTAVFSPTDTTDYASATAHVSLTVGSPSNPPSNPTSGPVGGPIGPAPVGCGGPTINVDSSMSTSTLQSTISSAPSCALVNFAAGTYNITAPITLQCGVTYTGPVAYPATAILNATFSRESATIFRLYSGSGRANPCSQPTSIDYFNFENAGGIYVQTSFTNLTISHNQFTNLPCCNNSGTDSGIWFDGSGASNNTMAMLSNTTVTWNVIGADSNSCETPTTGAMENWNGSMDVAGNCTAMRVVSSVNGLIFENNRTVHIGEGVAFACPSPPGGKNPCEPAASSGGGGVGVTTSNVTARYNDFAGVHRIAWEEQPQTTSGIDFEYNSEHDPFVPYYGNFDLSFACCENGATAPYLVVNNNVLIQNSPESPCPSYIGYGIEAHGTQASYSNNMIQGLNGAQYSTHDCGGSGPTSVPGIAWGFGANPRHYDENYICGPWFDGDYIVTEQAGYATPSSMVGNVENSTCNQTPSVAPAIAPSGGSQTFPLTVTMTDPGYTSGAQPLGNTSIYYTTDGSTPTVNSTLYTGSITLAGPATVKAIGMWGSGANAKTYPAGYGFAPSPVVTATFAGGSIAKPVATAKVSSATSTSEESSSPAKNVLPAGNDAAAATVQSVTITPSKPVVAIGSTTQLKAIATFSDGSVKDVTANFGWQSSDARTLAANASGVLAGLASGPAIVSGSYQGSQASVSASSAIGDVDWSSPIVITEGGTYSGNWQSTDAKTPAVTVSTTAPVVIENSHIRSAGNLIATTVAGSNLTVRNSLGVAVNAAVKGQPNGTFLEVASPARLDVENNYIENAQGGVIVHGYAGNRDGEQTIVIRANRARNLNGLLSDGNGGYLPGGGSNQSQARFIQFDSVQAVPGINVGWNEVINYPGHSLVEDNIDVYRSGGTPNGPLDIHDTYIQGAYPYRAAQDAYTGGGIKTDAKAGDSARDVPAFNSIHDNQVVGTVNYGIQFTAGHDNIAANNRVISSGLLADGTKIAAQLVGMANSDVTGAAVANGSMYNNAMHDNLIGWTCWQSSCAQQGYRKDQFFPAAPADYSTNSVMAPGQITLDMENNEYQIWVNKMVSAGVSVGPSF